MDTETKERNEIRLSIRGKNGKPLKAGRQWPSSEAPLRRRFADGPMVARHHITLKHCDFLSLPMIYNSAEVVCKQVLVLPGNLFGAH